MSARTPTDILTGILVSLHTLSQTGEHANGRGSAAMPDAARPCFLTLHLLYPHLLLDALDLLDRGLVTRLCVYAQDQKCAGRPISNDAQQSLQDEDTEMNATDRDPDDAQAIHRREIVTAMEEDDARMRAQAEDAPSQYPTTPDRETNPDINQRATPISLQIDGQQPEQATSLVPPAAISNPGCPISVTYHVRSAQALSYQQTRASAGATGSSQPAPPDITTRIYHVHLMAWHCSCPAFAHATFAVPSSVPLPTSTFSTLPGSGQTSTGYSQLPSLLQYGFGGVPAQRLRLQVLARAESGTSKSAVTSYVPPCCKHLMASVLAEAAAGLFTSDTSNVDAGMSTEQSGRKGVVEKWVGKAELPDGLSVACR